LIYTTYILMNIFALM